MAIAIMLCMIFAGVESNPASGYGGDWPTLGPVFSRAFPQTGTTFVDGVNAFLNITFLWIGQILYPTFIAEMERPQDFPKALYALTVAEFILFAVPAVVIYRYTGQYTEAPAFGSLQPNFKKISFSFVIVPTVIIGVIYANVAAKYIFSRVMRGSRHAHSHSLVGWGTWIGIMVVCWFLAFVIGSVIPSFGDFLSYVPASLPRGCRVTRLRHRISRAEFLFLRFARFQDHVCRVRQLVRRYLLGRRLLAPQPRPPLLVAPQDRHHHLQRHHSGDFALHVWTRCKFSDEGLSSKF